MSALKKISFLFLLSISLFSCKDSNYKKMAAGAFDGKPASFVGSESCIACHEQEYNLWKGSHHDLAMQVADSATVLGNFNDVQFTSKGIKYNFFRKDGDFYVNTEGEGGVYADYKIEYTFGVYPLQQYLIAFPGGRYQCLLAAWDSKANKWFDLQPNLRIHPDEWMHWTGGSMTWNTMCADCHSTNLHKNFDPQTNTYNTSFSIINVSCEACHGPSGNHVEYYQDQKKYADQIPPELYMGKVVAPHDLVEKCARCHSRRSQLTNFFDYQGHYLDHYSPQLPEAPEYEADGQIRDEDYVYGSFMQSKMYHNNVACKNCHDMHSLKLIKTGNELCLTCHLPKYNTYEHHYHKADTEGALCINCHMAGKYYMGNDFRRDHSFRVPRPDQTLAYGTPNACNNCHTDKSAQWAAGFIKEKYGDKRPEHFSDALLAGYGGDTDAFRRVFSQGKYPDIMRATALDAYSNRPLAPEQVQAIVQFLNDSSALVRNQAVLALDKLQQMDFSENVRPMLLDTIRLVRISAARYFNMRNLDFSTSPPYQKAQGDFMEYLRVNADFASGQHQIALYEQAKGHIASAITAYEKAITIDNYYNPSRLNLALLEYNKGNIEHAEQLYLKVTEQEPEYSYPYFMLGLLYNEKGNPEKSLEYLGLATQKQPYIERAFYNYALKLQENRSYDKSISVLNKALKNDPWNEELLYVKLLGELKTKKTQDAYTTCSKLLQIAPGNSNYQNIMNEIRLN